MGATYFTREVTGSLIQMAEELHKMNKLKEKELILKEKELFLKYGSSEEYDYVKTVNSLKKCWED